jgi:hypothetical protein
MTPISTPIITPIMTPISVPTAVPIATPVITPVVAPVITPIVISIVAPIPITTPGIIPIDVQISRNLFFGLERRKKLTLRQASAYAVAIKRRGKFIPVATNLTRGEALFRGANITLKNLARTFKIIPTGRTKEVFGMEEDFMPKEAQFRGYKVRKGKRIQTPNMFIQRSIANLQSREEKFAIAQAKRDRKIFGF